MSIRERSCRSIRASALIRPHPFRISGERVRDETFDLPRRKQHRGRAADAQFERLPLHGSRTRPSQCPRGVCGAPGLCMVKPVARRSALVLPTPSAIPFACSLVARSRARVAPPATEYEHEPVTRCSLVTIFVAEERYECGDPAHLAHLC